MNNFPVSKFDLPWSIGNVNPWPQYLLLYYYSTIGFTLQNVSNIPSLKCYWRKFRITTNVYEFVVNEIKMYAVCSCWVPDRWYFFCSSKWPFSLFFVFLFLSLIDQINIAKETECFPGVSQYTTFSTMLRKVC